MYNNHISFVMAFECIHESSEYGLYCQEADQAVHVIAQSDYDPNCTAYGPFSLHILKNVSLNFTLK